MGVTLHCDVYCKDKKTGRIDIEDGVLIRNDVYTSNIVEHPCPTSKTYEIVWGMLCDRVICRERFTDELSCLTGISKYNELALLRFYNGFIVEQPIWLKFDDDPEDLCFDDLYRRWQLCENIN